MSWQLALYIKLNISPQAHLIVSDETGLLFDASFIAFLEDRTINVQCAPTLQHLLKVPVNKPSIVVTSLSNIPTFIATQYDHKNFTYTDLPLNGDLSILRGLPTLQLVALLDYVFIHDRHKVISSHNIERLIADSSTYQRQAALKNQLNHIKHQLAESPTVDKILTLGKLWGELVYESTQLGTTAYVDLIENIDAFAEAFFFKNGMEQAILGSTDRNPQTVNRILGHIKRDKADKIALICFDCMGIAEWSLLKTYLSDLDLKYEEKAIFSLLPSITAIARSAIFHGNTQVYDLKYPGRTDESAAFARFFQTKKRTISRKRMRLIRTV
jgi:PglZ domain